MSWVTSDDDLNLSTANSDINVEEKVEDYTRLFDYGLKLLMLGGISIFFCDSDMTFKWLEDQRKVFNSVCSLRSWAAPLRIWRAMKARMAFSFSAHSLSAHTGRYH